MKLKTFTVPISLFQVIWMLTTCDFFFITQAEAGTNDCPYCDEDCSKFFNSGTGEGFRNCVEAQFKECCKKKHDKDWNDKVTNMQKEFEAAKKSQNKSDQTDAELKEYKDMLDSLIKQALEEQLKTKTDRKTTEEPKKVEEEKHKKEKEENEKDELVLIIVCSVAGVVLGAVIVGFIVCCVVYYKKRKRIQQQQSEGGTSSSAPAQGSVQPVTNQPQPGAEQQPHYYLGQSTPGGVVYAYTPNPA